MVVDLRALNNKLGFWWSDLIESQRAHLPDGKNINLERDGDTFLFKQEDLGIYFGFVRASGEEKTDYVAKQVGKLKSNSRLSEVERERRAKKIEMPRFAFFAGSSDLPVSKLSKEILEKEVERSYLSLERKERREFRGTYGTPSVVEGGEVYGGVDENILAVRGVVGYIPLGRRGKMSDKLFLQGRRGIFAPVAQAFSTFNSREYATRRRDD